MDLHHITGIDEASAELLEAAGVADVEGVAAADVETLHQELVKANALLWVLPEHVGEERVAEWIESAKALLSAELRDVDEEEGERNAGLEVDYEAMPQVQEWLANAPFALPLPARILVDHQVPVSRIPVGILLNRYVGDLDVRVDQHSPRPETSRQSGKASRFGGGGSGVGLDVLRMQAMTAGSVAAANPQQRPNDLVRTPRSSTNRGKNPNSRWYIRGVLHGRPLALYFGALVTLCFALVLPSAAVCAALLILSSEMPSRFAWVPDELLVVPILLPVLGVAYLLLGVGGKCRVCNERLFVHTSQIRNPKAHHCWGLGYVIPLCLHLLIFRWFRCTHCGTSSRVKE